MIIYNVTVKIDTNQYEDWLNWMKSEHIPKVMATGFFLKNELARVLVDEEDGITYSIQYRCNSLKDFEDYQRDYAPGLQKEHLDRYRDKFVAFRTLLELED
jgi:hypothetical protein